jgi:hypothetical protein
MDEPPENIAARLPDPATIEAVLARLPTGADETALAAALTDAFPGFPFSTANIDDQYWRDKRSVIAADGTRIAEYRPWMEAELAKDNSDIGTFWTRLRESDLQISEWHGNSVYAFAPTGPGAATMCKSVSAGKSNGVRGRSSIRRTALGARTNYSIRRGSRTKICPTTR